MGTKQTALKLLMIHVWGYLAYVLDPVLQDGKKLPKWKPHSQRGVFVGYSPQHASTIGMILNLTTKLISPQYTVAHDDYFATMHADGNVIPEE